MSRHPCQRNEKAGLKQWITTCSPGIDQSFWSLLCVGSQVYVLVFPAFLYIGRLSSAPDLQLFTHTVTHHIHSLLPSFFIRKPKRVSWFLICLAGWGHLILIFSSAFPFAVEMRIETYLQFLFLFAITLVAASPVGTEKHGLPPGCSSAHPMDKSKCCYSIYRCRD